MFIERESHVEVEEMVKQRKCSVWVTQNKGGKICVKPVFLKRVELCSKQLPEGWTALSHNPVIAETHRGEVNPDLQFNSSRYVSLVR